MSYFVGQSYFNNDEAQLLFIFQPILKNITAFSGLSDTISEWESKGLSNEELKPPYTANKSLSPKLVWNKLRVKLRFTVSCLKQDKVAFTPSNLVNLFIVYELYRWSQDLNAKFTHKDCLFGNVKITKNANPNIYSCAGYEIGFNFVYFFWFQILIGGKNVNIFGVGMSSSVHINNTNKDILILGKGQTQRLDNTALTGEV